MAEIDWDKVIREAQSKKREQARNTAKDKAIDKRLDRMEKMLEKVSKEKSDYKDIVPDAPDENGDSRKEKLEKAGFKFVKVEKKRNLSPGIDLDVLKKFFSSTRNIAIIAIIAAAAIAGGAYLAGWIPGDGFALPGATTLFVCPDGVTMVENATLCPTTTTTTTTTLAPTTTTTTSSTTTTTTTIGAPHTVAISSASCSGGVITVNLVNAGPTVDMASYVVFYVDGTRDDLFLCTGNALASGESTTCHSGSVSSGTHTVEARGLVNIAYATVTC